MNETHPCPQIKPGMMTVEVLDYGSVEHRGAGSTLAAITEGLTEEGAFELRFERGFLVQRIHQLLPRPGGASRERCEQGSIKLQRRAEAEEGLGALEKINGQSQRASSPGKGA